MFEPREDTGEGKWLGTIFLIAFFVCSYFLIYQVKRIADTLLNIYLQINP